MIRAKAKLVTRRKYS